MSLAFVPPRQRGKAVPDQATIQKMLDENNQLIQAIVDYQNKGRASEVAQYQQILHRNLVYLATIADSNQGIQNLLAAPNQSNANMPTPPQGMNPPNPPSMGPGPGGMIPNSQPDMMHPQQQQQQQPPLQQQTQQQQQQQQMQLQQQQLQQQQQQQQQPQPQQQPQQQQLMNTAPVSMPQTSSAPMGQMPGSQISDPSSMGPPASSTGNMPSYSTAGNNTQSMGGYPRGPMAPDQPTQGPPMSEQGMMGPPVSSVSSNMQANPSNPPNPSMPSNPSMQSGYNPSNPQGSSSYSHAPMPQSQGSMMPRQSMPSNQPTNQQQFHMPQHRYPQQQGMMAGAQNGNQGNQMMGSQQQLMGGYRQPTQTGQQPYGQAPGYSQQYHPQQASGYPQQTPRQPYTSQFQAPPNQSGPVTAMPPPQQQQQQPQPPQQGNYGNYPQGQGVPQVRYGYSQGQGIPGPTGPTVPVPQGGGYGGYSQGQYGTTSYQQ